MADAPEFQKRVGKKMAVLAWICFFLLGWLFFDDYLGDKFNPNQDLTVSEGGPRMVRLKQNSQGHYVAPGEINNQPVIYLLDTGATGVSIPGEVARRLNLKAGGTSQVHTANGAVTVYRTRLDKIALGNIVLYNLQAHINPHMEGETILLGMKFMRDLEMVQRGDELTLRQY